MSKSATLKIDDKEIELPVIVGTENEVAVDIRKLRSKHGIITYDAGYGSTGSCQSSITFINGEKGILRYRGYAIEELAEKASFIEAMYLTIYGELPTQQQLDGFRAKLDKYSLIHEDMKNFFGLYPEHAHPMAVLSSMVTALSTFSPSSDKIEDRERDIIKLLAQVKSLAAYAYRKSVGLPFIYPRSSLSYGGDFLNMMFKRSPVEDYKINPIIEDALNKLLILHLDHEQNCSASTVRMVGSSQGNIYSAVSAGIAALWGPLHGGANQKVLEMLQAIVDDSKANNETLEQTVGRYMEMAKDKSSDFRLMGFGHRVYKNFDPRAIILKTAADDILKELNVKDPLLEVAKRLEEIALKDQYFVDRKLYPNVDFYSGIIYKALGIPIEMFTVMFTLGRLPGWLAQWRESREDPHFRIHRPRQVYIGPTERKWVNKEDRG